MKLAEIALTALMDGNTALYKKIQKNLKKLLTKMKSRDIISEY